MLENVVWLCVEEEEEKDSGEQREISIWHKLSPFSSSIFFSIGSYSFLSGKHSIEN